LSVSAYNGEILSDSKKKHMWNSIEGLARLFYASQWAMAILGALTALAIVFSIVVSIRKDRLVDEKTAQDARDHKAVIEAQNHQISTLNDQLGEARDYYRN
jgi:hypothetical protein